MRTKLALATILSLVFTPLTAQDFNKGYTAYQAGDYATALQEWKPLAEQGDPSAQSSLGAMYDYGLGVPQDYAEAVKWYRLAAEQGNAEAQRRVGHAYAMGDGVVQDFGEASKWLLLSAKQGNAAGQAGIGMSYAGGHGIETNETLGYMWLTISVNNFGAETEYARVALGWIATLSTTMTAAEIHKAKEMADTCADSGYTQCDETLDGNPKAPIEDMFAELRSEAMASDGFGDPNDPNYGKNYGPDMAEGGAALIDGDYTTAIEKFVFWGMVHGDAKAQVMLGAIAADGFGDINNPDYAQALVYYTLAAEQNLAAGQLALGELYRDGKGVTKDYNQAVEWFRLAAIQGLSAAQDNLGIIYSTGEGVERDYSEALKWWKMSAKQGNFDVQSDIGIMYEYGFGIPQSNIMAYMWYNIAAANGQSEAVAYRDERAGLMTSADIFKAQAMARECMSSGYSQCGDTAEIPSQVLANDYRQSQRCSGAFGIMTSIGFEYETSPAYQYFSDLADFHTSIFEYYFSQQNASYVMGDVSKAVSQGLMLVDREAIEDPSSLQANVKHCLSWLSSVQQYFGQQDRDTATSIVMGGMPSPSDTYEYPFSDWTPMIPITELAYELWVQNGKPKPTDVGDLLNDMLSGSVSD